jgi:UDP-N-acetylglucosamine--N-acetylmuramyl-(pentapeptide) pyrophosphoryl-undecaprenol N-acetylglucosamine transferase
VLELGGSQGASGINQLVIRALPCLAQLAPELQWLHLAGVGEVDYVNRAYAALRIKAVVHSFLSEMEMALGAATAAITRAGASTLAELAAVRLPAVLIPFPNAADDHQLHNARAFEISGAACLLEQNSASPERVAGLLLDLLRKPVLRDSIQHALAGWHVPLAAEQIAERILLAHELMFKARAQPSAPIARLSTVDSQAPPLATRTS